jgi:hypothetical protein
VTGSGLALTPSLPEHLRYVLVSSRFALVSRSPIRFTVALSLFAAACGSNDGDAHRNTAASRAAARTPDTKSVGEVVIRPSKPAYSAAAVVSPGTVSGTVTLTGPVAPSAPTPTGPSSALCGATIPDESIQQQGNGLAFSVVWLDGVRSGKPLPVERRLELESDKCRLAPRVQATVIGSAVNVLGHDSFRQHLSWSAGGETGPRVTVLLGQDEQVIPTELPARAPGLVEVTDRDHPWPRAYVAVFDHPYFAVTSGNGTFTIDGVPPGKYTLRAWHERAAPYSQPVEIVAGRVAIVSVPLAQSRSSAR